MGLKTTIEQEKLVFAFALKKPTYLLKMGGDFYSNPDLQYLANVAKQFYNEYKESPSCEQMKSLLRGDDKNIPPEIVDGIYNVDINAYDIDYLRDVTEGWIMYRTLNHNLFGAATLIKTSDVSLSNVKDIVHRCAEMVADTNTVSFDNDLGADFFDIESHKSIKENKIPYTWDYWNKVSHGGLDPKTLTCYVGATNVGKSIFLCNDAAYFVSTGKNVLFVTCEMSKEKVTRRISANLFDMKLEDYDKLVENGMNVKKKINQFIKNNSFPVGKLRVKELPTGQGTVNDIEKLIKEVQEVLKYKVDVVVIDYINIMCNYRNPNTENTYMKIKQLAEDLRGLAVKYDVLMITATQTGRNAIDCSDINLTDISESMGLGHTVDNLIGIIQTEEMRIGEMVDDVAVPYYYIKILKIREGEGKDDTFKVHINYSKMKLIEKSDVTEAGLIFK